VPSQLCRATAALLSATMLTACVNPNELAMRIGKPPEQAAQIRESETRRLQGDEATLLAEATQVMQDLGYTVSESSAGAGVLAGTKSRDATEAGQVAGAIVMAVLFGAASARWDTDQMIRLTVTTWPEGSASPLPAGSPPRTVAMRVSFERLIGDNRGMVRHEALIAPELQREFFEKLGQSLSTQGNAV
jgi:hypothetical protein